MREAVEGSVKETEQIRISSNLRDNEIYIRKQCENCADILVRPMRLEKIVKWTALWFILKLRYRI